MNLERFTNHSKMSFLANLLDVLRYAIKLIDWLIDWLIDELIDWLLFAKKHQLIANFKITYEKINIQMARKPNKNLSSL